MGTNYSPKTITDGLILSIDIGNPKSYAGSGVLVSDLSKARNDMTMFGSMTPTFPAGFTYPPAQITHYLIANPFTYPSTEVTMETWVRVPNFSSNCFLGFCSPIANNESLNLTTSSTSINVWVGVGNMNATLSKAMPINTWFNYVYKTNRITGSQTIYLNGEIVYSGVFAAGTLFNTDGALVFGQEQDLVGGGFASGQNFRGDSPVYKIYDRELSDDEVKQNFNALRGRFGI